MASVRVSELEATLVVQINILKLLMVADVWERENKTKRKEIRKIEGVKGKHQKKEREREREKDDKNIDR